MVLESFYTSFYYGSNNTTLENPVYKVNIIIISGNYNKTRNDIDTSVSLSRNNYSTQMRLLIIILLLLLGARFELLYIRVLIIMICIYRDREFNRANSHKT